MREWERMTEGRSPGEEPASLMAEGPLLREQEGFMAEEALPREQESLPEEAGPVTAPAGGPPTELEQLADAAKTVALAYLVLQLDVNLGSLNILPNWLAYLLMVNVLPVLGKREPTALLLRPLGIFLGLWEGLLWVGALFSLDINVYAFPVVAAAAGLYFHFQLLTNLAGLAEGCGCPERKRILRLRSVFVITLTLFALPFPWEENTTLMVIGFLVHMVVALWICVVLFYLRYSLWDVQRKNAAGQDGQST
ncbi:MAG: hypothetical protein Q4C22_03555 [Bacillota bacterium]|nr:hypothetical protein [Bacillota bacterium]